jgi:hypothetical protein
MTTFLHVSVYTVKHYSDDYFFHVSVYIQENITVMTTFLHVSVYTVKHYSDEITNVLLYIQRRAKSGPHCNVLLYIYRDVQKVVITVMFYCIYTETCKK